MNGIVVLQGGGPFRLHDDLDGRLLKEVKAKRVVVLPTADAFERPEELVAVAREWGKRLGIEIEPLMVMRRTEALDPSSAQILKGAKAVWLVGDNPIHLRSVIKDTPIWDAMCAILDDGGLIVGAGQSASALCDPMIDPRGGALALGLGMMRGMAIVCESEMETSDRHARTKKLANVPLVFLPSASALVRRSSTWEHIGPSEILGELPIPVR